MYSEFDAWFNSLSEQEQQEYIKERDADYWVDYYKSNQEYE